uniref:Prolactin releasing hormone 2 n=1 Tax=Astatotilapia calliptera TaxID=8154 RepID=A0A3P8NAD8_ASTCA
MVSYCNILYFTLQPCHLSFFSLLFLHLCCSDPDISASWYTGRGIRPLGRFGRKAARRNELLAFITARVYRPTADSDLGVF